MTEKQIHNIILLGGHDLEMLTIKELLEKRKDCIVCDKKLKWENAKLSAYQKELDEYKECNIYGIELEKDIDIPTPANYHQIDHHNEDQNRPSSIEQIVSEFNIPMTRDLQLIAANDKGYIAGMKEINATDAEIEDIRRRDRLAQGLTEEDERLAQQSIEENLTERGNLVIVEALTPKFSAICDRIRHYEKLLIFNDSKWSYYGIGKDLLVNHFEKEKKEGKIYHGGGKKGFIASKTNAFTLEKHCEQLDYIKKLDIFSYHNFMFPFQWRIKEKENETFSDQINLNNIFFSDCSNWERAITQKTQKDNDVLYDEKNYFYEFIHDALYDTGKDNSLIRHYERKECQHGNVTYTIQCWNKEKEQNLTYELIIGALNLNLYSTGVGVLSFYLYNNKYEDFSDILCINQYGRRVYPPYIGSVQKEPREIIADYIEINGLHGNGCCYKEDFKKFTNQKKCNTPANFINEIITEIATNIQIKPVIDDRMFVQCWYKNSQLTNKLSKRKGKELIHSSEWYEYVFVDSPQSISCQDDGMQKKLINKATYKRWQKYNSIYGISRYSVVFLTNYSCPDFLFNTFESIYARMTELILVQKASVLRFSSEVTNISNMDDKKDFGKKVSSLYKEYIRFVNQIHFREVSAQDQGIELYKMLYDTLNVGEHVEKLDAEIEELYNYVTLKEDRKSNSTMSRLTWIATIAVPLTLMAGVFGMNNFELNGKSDGQTLFFWNYFWGQLGISIIITFFVIITILLINKRKEK